MYPEEKRFTVLAIDDDPVILNSVLSILKGRYDARPFISGKTALKYLSKHTADLILIDYQMPEMNGFEVMERLQEDDATRDIPIIFLTGSEDGDSEVRALERGAVDYLLKPIKPKVLLTRLRLQLELQSYRRHLESMVQEKTDSLRVAYNQLKVREEITLNLLARATDMRDHHTGDHIRRTTEYVRVIVDHIMENPCEGYTLGRDEASAVIKSSKLHDIGKIAMPDHVLLKLGKLTSEEFDIVKQHPEHGARMLSEEFRIVKQHPENGARLLGEFVDQMGEDSFLRIARDIAFSHHEKWNGKGYPQGLQREEIPLSARIVALADVYDALRSERPYKKHFSHQDSVKIISEDSGAHFDPYIVSIFLKYKDKFEKISISTDS